MIARPRQGATPEPAPSHARSLRGRLWAGVAFGSAAALVAGFAVGYGAVFLAVGAPLGLALAILMGESAG